MRIVTATAATQGQRGNDFDFCVEGELVLAVVVICRKDRDDPDGACGCGRAWAGAASQRSTTTAMVRELPLTVAEYTEAVRSSLEDGDWWPEIVDDLGVREMVAHLLAVARSYPVGAVLERRLDVVGRRAVAVR